MIQIIQCIFISMLIILFGHFVYQFIKEIFTVPKINIIKPTEISANAPPPHPQPQPPMQTMQTVPITPTLTASNDENELQQHMNHLINNSNSNSINSNNMQDELNNYIKNKIKAN